MAFPAMGLHSLVLCLSRAVIPSAFSQLNNHAVGDREFSETRRLDSDGGGTRSALSGTSRQKPYRLRRRNLPLQRLAKGFVAGE